MLHIAVAVSPHEKKNEESTAVAVAEYGKYCETFREEIFFISIIQQREGTGFEKFIYTEKKSPSKCCSVTFFLSQLQ